MSESLITTPKDCVVIGGGYTGLSAAYELAKAGHSVAVIESDNDVGGLAEAIAALDRRHTEAARRRIKRQA